MSGWVEMLVVVAEDTAVLVSERLRPFAEAESVVIEQLGDPADLTPDAMLPDVHVKIYFSAEQDTPAHRQFLTQALADIEDCEPPQFTLLQEVDWATAWQAHYQPLRVGQNFLIQPSWLPLEDTQPEDVVLTLDPGMAFGTGQHATTQLCLQALERYVQPGQAVLDVGTGSGILAIAAAKLGARPLAALDTDPHATTAVVENAAHSHITTPIAVHTGPLKDLALPRRHWDFVLANILAAILHPLIADEALLDYARPGGYYIFSGIITAQEDDFKQTLTTAGLTVVETLRQEGWVAIVAQMPQ